MNLNPYLHFNGNAEEALEHYRDALGGEIEILRYAGSPAERCAPSEWGSKVLHGALRSRAGLILASDATTDRVNNPGDNFEVAIQVDTEKDADSVFGKLATGGQVTMPLDETFFSPKFGMLTDKFGIKWMVVCQVPAEREERSVLAV